MHIVFLTVKYFGKGRSGLRKQQKEGIPLVPKS